MSLLDCQEAELLRIASGDRSGDPDLVAELCVRADQQERAVRFFSAAIHRLVYLLLQLLMVRDALHLFRCWGF